MRRKIGRYQRLDIIGVWEGDEQLPDCLVVKPIGSEHQTEAPWFLAINNQSPEYDLWLTRQSEVQFLSTPLTLTTQMRSNLSPHTYVYLLAHPYFELCVKIGKSDRPMQRSAQIATVAGENLMLLGVVCCQGSCEFDLHSLLTAYRKEGEWFQLPTEVIVVLLKYFKPWHISPEASAWRQKYLLVEPTKWDHSRANIDRMLAKLRTLYAPSNPRTYLKRPRMSERPTFPVLPLLFKHLVTRANLELFRKQQCFSCTAHDRYLGLVSSVERPFRICFVDDSGYNAIGGIQTNCPETLFLYGRVCGRKFHFSTLDSLLGKYRSRGWKWQGVWHDVSPTTLAILLKVFECCPESRSRSDLFYIASRRWVSLLCQPLSTELLDDTEVALQSCLARQGESDGYQRLKNHQKIIEIVNRYISNLAAAIVGSYVVTGSFLDEEMLDDRYHPRMRYCVCSRNLAPLSYHSYHVIDC